MKLMIGSLSQVESWYSISGSKTFIKFVEFYVYSTNLRLVENGTEWVEKRNDVEWFCRCSLACAQAINRDGLQREEYLKIEVKAGRISGQDGRGYDRGAEWSSGRIVGRRRIDALYSGSIPRNR